MPMKHDEKLSKQFTCAWEMKAYDGPFSRQPTREVGKGVFDSTVASAACNNSHTPRMFSIYFESQHQTIIFSHHCFREKAVLTVGPSLAQG
jgi:hypothetical protein